MHLAGHMIQQSMSIAFGSDCRDPNPDPPPWCTLAKIDAQSQVLITCGTDVYHPAKLVGFWFIALSRTLYGSP